jgi:hypothetical protein
MTRHELLQFLRSHLLAVQASTTALGTPQAAVVGFVVTDEFEFFFDSVVTNRKVENLRRNPAIAIVVGGLTEGDERTAQFEGIVDEPVGAELKQLKEYYFTKFPTGKERQSWQGVVYFRARPQWIRYSDYNQRPPLIIEFDFKTIDVADT